MMTATLTALAEPNRLHIVELLRDGPLPVGEIVDHLRLHQPQVSKHLRVLSDAGIVEVHHDAQRRIYKLRPDPFRELEKWTRSYTRAMEERYGRLDQHLERMKKGVK